MRVVVRECGQREYVPTVAAMRAFTDARTAATPDELWCVEHPPVFTLGRAGRREHLLAPGRIAVVETDRGGQVTYHGPGQQVIYTLVDVGRLGIGPRELVRRLEQGLIELLADYGIRGARRPKAPGVYVDGAKIAALGLRIRRHCSYHGVALNVGLDLAPFDRINPCGMAGLAVTRLADLGGPDECAAVRQPLVRALCAALYPGLALELVRATPAAAEAESPPEVVD